MARTGQANTDERKNIGHDIASEEAGSGQVPISQENIDELKKQGGSGLGSVFEGAREIGQSILKTAADNASAAAASMSEHDRKVEAAKAQAAAEGRSMVPRQAPPGKPDTGKTMPSIMGDTSSAHDAASRPREEPLGKIARTNVPEEGRGNVNAAKDSVDAASRVADNSLGNGSILTAGQVAPGAQTDQRSRKSIISSGEVAPGDSTGKTSSSSKSGNQRSGYSSSRSSSNGKQGKGKSKARFYKNDHDQRTRVRAHQMAWTFLNETNPKKRSKYIERIANQILEGEDELSDIDGESPWEWFAKYAPPRDLGKELPRRAKKTSNFDDANSKDIETQMNARFQAQAFVSGEVEDATRKDYLIDRFYRDLKIGFFPIKGEKTSFNKKTKREEVRYSDKVESSIIGLCDYFGLNWNSMEAQRTIFRCVRLYASMSTDRHGKMFGGDENSWSLTEDEFAKICHMIFLSCEKFGNPFVAPQFTGAGRQQLRGTDIYPVGYIPKMVCDVLMNPGSKLAVDGHDSKWLQDECLREWNNRTYPTMIAAIAEAKAHEPARKRRRKVKKLVVDPKTHEQRQEKVLEEEEVLLSDILTAQRIVCEDVNEASAMLDGVGPELFGMLTGIDTAQHRRLTDLVDMDKAWASLDTMSPMMVSTVNEYRERQVQAEKERLNKRRKKKTLVHTACNIAVAGAKTNALFWQLPIAMSAYAEKGVGDLQTYWTLKLYEKLFDIEPGKVQIPDDMKEAFRTREAAEVVDSLMILMEMGGPTALVRYAEESGGRLNHDLVMEWLGRNVESIAGTKSARVLQDFNNRLSQIQQKILTGKWAFYKQSNNNFLLAMFIHCAIAEHEYSTNPKAMTISNHIFTTDQLIDAFQAASGNVERFLLDTMRFGMTSNALKLMRMNNIGNINPISYKVSEMMSRHGLTNLACTLWLDTFVNYGINFCYMMTPMSRTFTYLACKGLEQRGGKFINAGNFAIGGEFSGPYNGSTLERFQRSPMFVKGLMMNVIADCVTLGRWTAMAILLGGILGAIGYDPPDKEEDFFNLSMWRIGGNLGWGPDTDGDGKGDGVEVQDAFWINDLTQFGLPGAHIIAAQLWANTPGNELPDSVKNDPNWRWKLFYDGLTAQYEGNVVLDVFNSIKNFEEDIEEITKMLNDPNYDGDIRMPALGVQRFVYQGMSKLTPGSPLYAAWGRSALLRGPRARMYDTTKVYDYSEDWMVGSGKTVKVTDEDELLKRKWAARDWLLAAFLDLTRQPSDTGTLDPCTGYFWFQMPVKTFPDQLALAQMKALEIDDANIPYGMTVEQYHHLKAEIGRNYIKDYIDRFGSVEAAVANGMILPTPIKEVMRQDCFSEIHFLENEYDAVKAAGGYYTDEQYQEYKRRKNELYDYIDTYLSNDSGIPTWDEGYQQLLTDIDISYVNEDGTPSSKWDSYFDPTVKTVWNNKGNHPNTMLPWTWVDYSSNDEVTRDSYGETVNKWFDEGVTDLEAIRNGIGRETLTIGRDKGKTLNDSLFDQNPDGTYRHPDQPTLNIRAMVKRDTMPTKSQVTYDNVNGGIYGEQGMGSEAKSNKNANSSNGSGSGQQGIDSIANGKNVGAAAGAITGSGNKNEPSWIKQMYNTIQAIGAAGKGELTYGEFLKQVTETPKGVTNGSTGGSMYSKKVYRRSGGGGGGYDYNPKIYSNPHSLYSSKPATMYSKTPYSTRNQTYLRPSFSTKGSREAYKRQDF